MVFCKLLLSLADVVASTKIVPIPRFHVDALSPKEFDDLYLDKQPVILSSTTFCPEDLTAENIGTFCHGDVQNFIKIEARELKENKENSFPQQIHA